MTNHIPTLDEMVSDLQERGWRRYVNPSTRKPSGAYVWQSPDGRLYRGPYRAWTIATGNLEDANKS